MTFNPQPSTGREHFSDVGRGVRPVGGGAYSVGGTIAYDAVSSVTGGVPVSTNQSWTHTPAGTPAAALVIVIVDGQGDNAPGDTVSGVTYGGAAMTEVSGSPWLLNTGTEDCTIHAFLKSTPAAGAQTVAVTVTAAWFYTATCVTVTASGLVSVDATATLDSASMANPSLSVTTTAAQETVVIGALHSGRGGGAADAAPGAAFTQLSEVVFGAGYSSSTMTNIERRTVNPTGGSVTVDWTTAGADEAHAVAIALKSA